ncbi:DUF2232 domain-containing protein [Oricola cellulosilytica]|uniref:DUF2232 domain-containing protein n=1 Tax=Oricola cellulosilytica TaxID=1429082 RepID=A0A4R0PDL2_9HYPH|nr:DUF2232 domain-containing protein [Oricola cellulosilytica]TCD14295.1 DUF2232 domain-containing protein [Oricola cellulosilytica]
MASRLTPETGGRGALAGAATALLCLGLSSGTPLAALLYFISPVPLMIAGLGFGLNAALVGATVAIVATLLTAGGTVATLVALSIAVPACASAFWLNLARPAEEIGGPRGKIAWYPLADVLLAVSLLTGLAYVVLGFMVGFGPEMAAELADELINRFKQANPEVAFTPEGVTSLQNFIEAAIPVAQPFMWMLTLTASIYLALAVARRSGLTRRPKDDWPVALRMPRTATFAFLAAILVSFAPGGIGHAASSFAGALAAGFTLAGFAMLHQRTRGTAGRTAILVLAYVGVAFIAFVAVFFFIAGIFGTGRHVPLSPGSPQSSSSASNID